MKDKNKLVEYNTWQAMKARCHNKNHKQYKHYGGRGVTVCDEWRNSFDTFYVDMGARPSLKHSIDRIDNDGNYCKENCRWATRKEQCNNTRRNTYITTNGIKEPIIYWVAGKECPFGKIKMGESFFIPKENIVSRVRPVFALVRAAAIWKKSNDYRRNFTCQTITYPESGIRVWRIPLDDYIIAQKKSRKEKSQKP